jgi:hypothetical protein
MYAEVKNIIKQNKPEKLWVNTCSWTGGYEKSNLKEILSFSFKGADSVEVPADELTVNFRNDTFFLHFLI